MMFVKPLRAALLLWVAVVGTATANPVTPEQIAQLSRTSEWRALLHYNPVGLGANLESQVDDAAFFLAADGKHNPVHELQATLAAFYFPAANPNAHAICRFPARWRWLQQTLALAPAPVEPGQCSELHRWRHIIKPHSVTLVFASSYLNSPSSMFGHTFLRIDPEGVETGSSWLSYAVNFGAELNSGDNSLLYAYKGLLGGYPGFFSVVPYYEKINEYRRIENRDLWEYELNLSPEEVDRLANHLWELRDIVFDYYFFDENCSYRLLELLEVARPGTYLRADFEHRAIPVDTVRAAEAAGFVRQVHYRPSEASAITHNINQLTGAQQQQALQLAQQEISVTDAALLAHSNAEQAQILRVAYQHLRYQQLERQRDPAVASHSLALLKQLRLRQSSETVSPVPAVAPDDAHDTLLMAVAGGSSDNTQLIDLRIRTSYHDLADNSAGYMDGAAINLGELVLRQREGDSLQIELLNLVDISSHSPRDLFFNPLSWRIKAGLERSYSGQDDVLAPRVEGGAGVTYRLGERHLGYGLAMARAEYNALNNTNLGVGAGALIGALFYLPFGTLQPEARYYEFTDGNARYHAQITHNLPLGRNHSLRLAASRQRQVETRFNEVTLEYRHYF